MEEEPYVDRECHQPENYDTDGDEVGGHLTGFTTRDAVYGHVHSPSPSTVKLGALSRIISSRALIGKGSGRTDWFPVTMLRNGMTGEMYLLFPLTQTTRLSPGPAALLPVCSM